MSELPLFLFLHIPKTAGTSFRISAREVLGAKYCHFDYGPDSHETSATVRKYVYAKPDLFRLGQELAASRGAMIGGHVNFRRYAPLIGSEQVVTFVRNPRQQLMSHFAHFVRLNGYREGLGEFLETPFGAGMQTRVFGGFPVEAIGLIGVTERYKESLRVFNSIWPLAIEESVRNVNPQKPTEGTYPIPEELKDKYDEAAAEDDPLYRRANDLLDSQIAAIDGGYAYVHGAVQQLGKSFVRGFAFRRGCDRPVTLELEVNGRRVASAEAVQDRPGLRTAKVARNAFVGFELRPKKRIVADDDVVIKVAATGQVIHRESFQAESETTST